MIEKGIGLIPFLKEQFVLVRCGKAAVFIEDKLCLCVNLSDYICIDEVFSFFWLPVRNLSGNVSEVEQIFPGSVVGYALSLIHIFPHEL